MTLQILVFCLVAFALYIGVGIIIAITTSENIERKMYRLYIKDTDYEGVMILLWPVIVLFFILLFIKDITREIIKSFFIAIGLFKALALILYRDKGI